MGQTPEWTESKICRSQCNWRPWINFFDRHTLHPTTHMAIHLDSLWINLNWKVILYCAESSHTYSMYVNCQTIERWIGIGIEPIGVMVWLNTNSFCIQNGWGSIAIAIVCVCRSINPSSLMAYKAQGVNENKTIMRSYRWLDSLYWLSSCWSRTFTAICVYIY